MAINVGIIELTPQPGFPTLKGKEGDETLKMKYTCAESELSALPDYGDSFTDTRYPFFCSLTRHLLEVKDISRDESGEFYWVELEFKNPEGGGADVPSGPIKEEWEKDGQDYDVPIEQHPDYLIKWNHKIICKKGVNVAYSGWGTAIGTKIPAPDNESYAWIKPGDAIKDGWEIFADEIKKGVESFRSGITTVTLVQRCTDLKKLIISGKNEYKRQTPANTFDKEGEWLRGGSKLKKEGRFWVMTTSWINRMEWDHDIYKGAT